MFAQRRITKLARVCIVSHSFGQALEAEGFARGFQCLAKGVTHYTPRASLVIGHQANIVSNNIHI